MFIPFCVCAYSLKDPYASLKGFDVKGEISPIAAHCCAVIGSSSFPVICMLFWAMFQQASVRKALIL